MTYIDSRTSLSATLRSLLPSLQDDTTEEAIITTLLRCCQQWRITTESELLLLLVSDTAFVRRRLLTTLTQEHRQQAFWYPADVQRLIEKVLLAISRHHISQNILSTPVRVERGNDISFASKSVADMLLPVTDSEGSMSTSSLHSDPRFFTTGCPSLDVLLAGVGVSGSGSGGFRAGLLTEVYGEAGSGKTQLVLQCLLHCVARQQCEECNFNILHKDCGSEFKRGVAALYIVSEDFPAARLSSLAAGALEMEKERATNTVSHLPSSTVARFKLLLDEAITVRSVMAGMHIRRITGLKDLMQMLHDGTLSNAFHTLGGRGVIVVDSIAGAAVTPTSNITTSNNTTSDGVDIGVVPSSSGEVLAVGSLLKTFAVQHGAAVVVTNQVRAQLSSSTAASLTTTYTSSAAVVPALGLAWSLAPHVRVQLRRSATTNTTATALGIAVDGTHTSSAVMAAERRLTVLSGPAHPPVCGVYTITTDGIRCDS
ncbi:DNA recombination and repair protein Rad51-like [Trypanosoma melophagium]|uniref:DNA recombination and repair protein Rad51-like n=1 Tax=Trypanosoma melophagium TaxID=715481 RepID=UPI003519FD95|nr:DNA recombination and repair protein Rad51-like [Trypanosoma melophagium]